MMHNQNQIVFLASNDKFKLSRAFNFIKTPQMWVAN